METRTKLAEARRRWGAARVLTGSPKPKTKPQTHPTTPPAAPAVALAA
jgi:hypothetical protein